ncbi:MAG: hypothetical protein WA990_02840 [Rubrobacteraceae bacterium]
MQPTRTSGEDALTLWYELGRRYSRAEGGAHRSTMLGFTVACVAGALVLLSGLFFGVQWAGTTPGAVPVVAFGLTAVPVAAGLLSGGGLFLWERARVLRHSGILRKALEETGADVGRPARDGLHAYYDAQLVLLRSEYEFLRLKGSGETARLFEACFGFIPEDGFETGPLNVTPDGDDLRRLREKWERRISLRGRSVEPPRIGLREDLAYHVFPREMTVPVELATRAAYLEISCGLLRKRYGRDPLKKSDSMPPELRRRIERDLGERAALTRKVRR